MDASKLLCFKDYDVFGFDIDHTLAKYNIPNLFTLLDDSFSKYMVENKKWDDEDLKKPFDKDFCTRGLVFDRKKGNVLKLAEDGLILRASHGTKFMSPDEIEKEYGSNRHWPDFETVIENVNNIEDKFRIFENFFDMPILVALARMVDTVERLHADHPEDKRSEINFDTWPALLDAVEDCYAQPHYKLNVGGFFPEWKKHTSKYVEPCSQSVKDWLKRLKAAGKTLFVMSSSLVDYATHSMEHIFGDDWKDYFDFYITNARKPGFFKTNRHFLATENNSRELYPVLELEQGGVYSQGNLTMLNKHLQKVTGKTQPKVLFFGDSLRSDISPAKKFAGWDTVMILEEMLAEQWQGGLLLHKGEEKDEPASKKQRAVGPSQLEKEFLTSESWGSFFTDDHTPLHLADRAEHALDKPYMNTLWGYMIRIYADLAIPQLEYITDFPLDHEFTVFNHEATHQWGFYPDIPLALRKPEKPLERESQGDADHQKEDLVKLKSKNAEKDIQESTNNDKCGDSNTDS